MSGHHTWLHRELERWTAEGLVGREQAATLRSRYPVEQGGGWGRLVLSAIGAILVGLGVILLIAYNWEDLPKGAKLALVFGALIAAHGAGVRLGRGGATTTSEGFHALGTMLFGAGIWLVAQIYHIDEHYPNAFLFWGLGALGLAWTLPSVTQALMAVTLVLVWQAVEVLDFHGAMHSAPWLLLVGLYPLFWRLRSRLLGASATLALLVSLALSTLHLGQPVTAPLLMLVAAAAVGFGRFLAGLPDPGLARCAGAFARPGWLGAIALLFVLGFPGVAGDILGPDPRDLSVASYLGIALLVTVGVWGLVVAAPLSGRPRTWTLGDLGLLAATVLVLVLPYLGAPDGWIAAAPFNLLLLALGVHAVIDGSRHDRPDKMLAGTLLLIVLAFTRYLDLFESLLARSLAFFLAGALLFAIGNFYTRRRRGTEGAP